MNIYVLEVIDHNYVDYDSYDGKVVVAENEVQARKISNKRTGDEGKVWEDAKIVSCRIIDVGETRVVLASFRAG